jgi:hypothetical protein
MSYLVFAKQMTNVPAACRVAPVEEAKTRSSGDHPGAVAVAAHTAAAAN